MFVSDVAKFLNRKRKKWRAIMLVQINCGWIKTPLNEPNITLIAGHIDGGRK